jgi:GAF domain
MVTHPGLHGAFARILERAKSGTTTGIISVNLLEEMALVFKCEWATFWQANLGRGFLYAAVVWTDGHIAAQRLEEDTYRRQLTASEGTAGHVWRTRKPIWTMDIIRDMCLPRSLDAKQAGLRGGVWIPLKTVDVVYGVIELLGHNPLPASEETIMEVEQLAVSLGGLIQAAFLRGRAHGRT